MTNWKPIVGFLAGLLTGSAVTYICTKSSLTKKHAKELNDVRASALDNAVQIMKDRQQINKSVDILKKTEEGNIKSDKVEEHKTDTVESTGFKQREVDEYHDYAKQYAPSNDPETTIIDPLKPVERKPKPAPVSPTDDHSMSMIPYSIDPDDFGDKDNYETVYLTYFSDGILAYDDTDDIIEQYDLENTVGTDFKSGFGEYSDSTVYIRNNKTQIDYQIEKSHDSYYGDDR